jgi:hypothetical protein
MLRYRENKQRRGMVKPSRVVAVSFCIAVCLIVLPMIGLAQLACVQDFWIDVPPLHPGDMTQRGCQAWQVESGRINDALVAINDEHEYERKEYECNDFSDYTAGELAKECLTVKRAMSYSFEYPDGRTGLHHWVFIIVKVDGREVWVPIECTPPNGQRQKQSECDGCDALDDGCADRGTDEWPKIAHEPYYDLVTGELESGQRFDERYFGSIIVWDVATMTECRDPLPVNSGTLSAGRLAILSF